MKSYKRSLCAMILVTFCAVFVTVGLTGCCSTNGPGGGSFWSSEPEYQGPLTMKEYLNQTRPGVDLTKGE